MAVVQFASNTMRSGAHSVEDVAQALRVADQVILLKPADQWDINPLLKQINKPAHAFDTVGDIVQELKHLLKSGDQVLIMSNKGFDGIQQKLLLALRD